MDELRLRAIDLSEERDAHALVSLLDHYARDPMGGGVPLAPEAAARLVPQLRTIQNYYGALALSGARAVGLINCFTGFSTFAALPLFNIHDLVVHRDFRRQGVGAALLRWAEDQAHARGCCKLTLEVLANNAAAMAAYRRAGYLPYVLDPAAGNALLLQKLLPGS